MIKMLTAVSFKEDEPGLAAAEIQEQLAGQGGFLKNSVGLLFCSLDFLPSQVMQAVCSVLPFAVLGCTTTGGAIPGKRGGVILNLTVLTSDDIQFRAGFSEPLAGEEDERITRMYRSLSQGLSPSLILMFLPSLVNLPGDAAVSVLDREARGAPLFGIGALDMDTKIRTPKTFFNGQVFDDRMTAVLCFGALKPRFIMNTIWTEEILCRRARITASDGNRIIRINDKPAADYLRENGLLFEDKLDMLFMFPLALDAEEGEPPSMCIIYTLHDDGSLTCSTNIPEGSTLRVISPSAAQVFKTAKSISRAAWGQPPRDPLLIFSCVSRSIVLEYLDDELGVIQEELEALGGGDYAITYAGGEICPVYQRGALVNRYHNYGIIACLLSQDGENPGGRDNLKEEV
ncbi:MAG: FIST C-terminal domain-containing protein [Spirochaetales bacterium]|jgi:hypothetical protein|nr:FIST C-terminal domain-containing protein [Spirochaetales bacterium]